MTPFYGQETEIRLGTWITVFSDHQVLHSLENTENLISICKETGITDIYIQIYRADKAYYDSDLTDRSPFENVLNTAGEDLLPFLIMKASSHGIKTHAWINLLSLAHNYDADILKKFGEDVLTYDQTGRPSMCRDGRSYPDSYYARENQLFLEPGDWRVRSYLGDIVEEILLKYPGFSGLHLDYIRYPVTTPFIPGARFTSMGVSYGYNRLNLQNFTESTGIMPGDIVSSRSNALLWDDWRRKQVSRLVEYISEKARKVSPSVEITASIVPSIEKSYFATFQDWTGWLENNNIDGVIAMNYTDDTKLMKLYSSGLMMREVKDKVQIGIGAYLMKNDTKKIIEQLEYLKELSVPGIVLFPYDDLAENKELRSYLGANFKNNNN